MHTYIEIKSEKNKFSSLTKIQYIKTKK